MAASVEAQPFGNGQLLVVLCRYGKMLPWIAFQSAILRDS
jgi:hypothetical protein